MKRVEAALTKRTGRGSILTDCARKSVFGKKSGAKGQSWLTRARGQPVLADGVQRSRRQTADGSSLPLREVADLRSLICEVRDAVLSGNACLETVLCGNANPCAPPARRKAKRFSARTAIQKTV